MNLRYIKRIVSGIVFFFVSGFLIAQSSNRAISVKGKILVRPANGVSDQEFKSIIALHGGQSISHNTFINLHVVSVPENAEGASGNFTGLLLLVLMLLQAILL